MHKRFSIRETHLVLVFLIRESSPVHFVTPEVLVHSVYFRHSGNSRPFGIITYETFLN